MLDKLGAETEQVRQACQVELEQIAESSENDIGIVSYKFALFLHANYSSEAIAKILNLAESVRMRCVIITSMLISSFYYRLF